MQQDLSNDGENNKLGDMQTTPLDQHTLGLHMSKFCFSINAPYHINLERLLFVFVILFFLRPPLSFLYERATGILSWNKLDAI